MKYTMMSYVYSYRGGNPEKIDLSGMCDLACGLKMHFVNMVGCYQYSPQEIQKIVSAVGLDVLCYTTAMDFCNPGGLDKFNIELDKAVNMNSSLMLLLFGKVQGLKREENFLRTVDVLAQAAELAACSGITLTVENFPDPDGPFLSFSEMEKARQTATKLKFILDNGNCLAGNENPCDVLSNYHENIVHMHLKDWIPALQGMPVMMIAPDGREYTGGEFNQGCFDYSELIQSIQKCEYSGSLEIEYLGPSNLEVGLKDAITFFENGKEK